MKIYSRDPRSFLYQKASDKQKAGTWIGLALVGAVLFGSTVGSAIVQAAFK